MSFISLGSLIDNKCYQVQVIPHTNKMILKQVGENIKQSILITELEIDNNKCQIMSYLLTKDDIDNENYKMLALIIKDKLTIELRYNKLEYYSVNLITKDNTIELDKITEIPENDHLIYLLTLYLDYEQVLELLV